jgi:hypothetical protein
VRSSEKDFETLQLGAFATPGLLLAQGPVGLTGNPGSIRARSVSFGFDVWNDCNVWNLEHRLAPQTCHLSPGSLTAGESRL